MRAFSTIALSALILASPLMQSTAHAQAAPVCPIGKKDTELTLQRVMINFGKFLSPADSVVMDGTMNPSTVTDASLQEGIDGLAVSIACAHAVVEMKSEALMPAGARKLTGAERDSYNAAFQQAMAQFEQALVDYASTLQALIGAPAKDFAAADAQKKLVNKLADEAHAHFAN